MRDNPVKTTLASGGYAFGAMIFELFAPGIPQICRNAGADFVLYDMEHTGLSFETLKNQFALCRGLRIVPMVRVLTHTAQRYSNRAGESGCSHSRRRDCLFNLWLKCTSTCTQGQDAHATW